MKKLLVGLLVFSVLATTAFASVGIGIKNLVLNNTVDLVIKTTPATYTIGGTYVTSDNYLVTGSAVLECGLGLGAITDGANTLISGIYEKELAIGNNLALVLDINLLSYDSVTSSMVALNGGALGIRSYIW